MFVFNLCFYMVISYVENNNILLYDRKNGCYEEVDFFVLLYSLFIVGMLIILGNVCMYRFYF